MREKEKNPCEAPNHVDGCNRKGETIDHFTPKCIAKVLGWSNEQTNAPENKQHLSLACHREKDHDTPLRRDVLIFQLGGVGLNFEEHRTIFERGKLPKDLISRSVLGATQKPKPSS